MTRGLVALTDIQRQDLLEVMEDREVSRLLDHHHEPATPLSSGTRRSATRRPGHCSVSRTSLSWSELTERQHTCLASRDTRAATRHAGVTGLQSVQAGFGRAKRVRLRMVPSGIRELTVENPVLSGPNANVVKPRRRLRQSGWHAGALLVP